MSDFILNAEVRTDEGKGASRRLRRNNGVPAIVYGGKAGANDRKPVSITLKANELNKALESEAFYNSIITLKVDGKDEQVVLQDLQRHPAKALIWHADFLRVSKTSKIKAHVPLHFANEETCVGVKVGGGKLTRHLQSVDVFCTAASLPENIQVDVANLEVGKSLYLADLKLPKDVELVDFAHGVTAENNDAVISVIAVKGGDEEAPAAE
ncbi:MAG: 50S ribosomal protein L25/general stress protein Ctc [Venatoribacter sp.]